MLKRYILKKIFISIAFLFSIMLIYIIPDRDYKFKTELNYISNDLMCSVSK